MRLAGLLPSNAEVTARAGSSDTTTVPVDPFDTTFSELKPGLYPETLKKIRAKVRAWERMERMPSSAPSSFRDSKQQRQK